MIATAASISSSPPTPITIFAAFPCPARIPTATGRECRRPAVRAACAPAGTSCYRNRGDGAFEDVSEKSGIARAHDSFGFTAVAADFDGDGWQDIYVACDSTPSLFFHNNGNGTFTEEGLERGLALNPDGMEQAGMGLAVADVTGDGILDILKTHFADDTVGLYQGLGKGRYNDVTIKSGLAVETRYVSWGAAFPDLDHDGLPDIFIVTGNVYPDTERSLPAYPYRSTALLYRNLGGGRFEQLTREAGPALAERHSSRGLAAGDIDNDGDTDLLIWNRNEPPSLLRNDLKSTNHWLQVRLRGTRSNRAAIGATVFVQSGSTAAGPACPQPVQFHLRIRPAPHIRPRRRHVGRNHCRLAERPQAELFGAHRGPPSRFDRTVGRSGGLKRDRGRIRPSICGRQRQLLFLCST